MGRAGFDRGLVQRAHSAFRQPRRHRGKLPVEGRKIFGSSAAGQVQGVSEVHAGGKTVERLCYCRLVFSTDGWDTEQAAKISDNPRSIE